jgi:hypothetical protein
MFWTGVGLLILGVLWSLFKGYVVWDAARDLYNGGGVPTLDFRHHLPDPACGRHEHVAGCGGPSLFPGFSFVLYVGLALMYAWYTGCRTFGRTGARRQLHEVEARHRSTRQGKPLTDTVLPRESPPALSGFF